MNITFKIEKSEVRDMFSGLHPSQDKYKREIAKNLSAWPQFSDGLVSMLNRYFESPDKYSLEKYPLDCSLWAVNLAFFDLPCGSIKSLKDYVDQFAEKNGAEYNIRVDAHPIYFSIFPFENTIYCSFSESRLLAEEAVYLIKYSLEGNANRRADVSWIFSSSRSPSGPGDLFKYLSIG